MTYANTSNMTGLVDIFLYGNTATGGWFGPLILMCVGVILLFSMKTRNKMSHAFVASAFVTSILAVFLRVLNMVGNLPLGICFGSLLLGLIWLRWGK